MHPELRRRPRTHTAERLKLLYVAAGVTWVCTLVWWLFHVEYERPSLPPPRRVNRPELRLMPPPPPPDDPVSRAWRLRNEVLVDEHERSES